MVKRRAVKCKLLLPHPKGMDKHISQVMLGMRSDNILRVVKSDDLIMALPPGNMEELHMINISIIMFVHDYESWHSCWYRWETQKTYQWQWMISLIQKYTRQSCQPQKGLLDLMMTCIHMTHHHLPWGWAIPLLNVLRYVKPLSVKKEVKIFGKTMPYQLEAWHIITCLDVCGWWKEKRFYCCPSQLMFSSCLSTWQKLPRNRQCCWSRRHTQRKSRKNKKKGYLKIQMSQSAMQQQKPGRHKR